MPVVALHSHSVITQIHKIKKKKKNTVNDVFGKEFGFVFLCAEQ